MSLNAEIVLMLVSLLLGLFLTKLTEALELPVLAKKRRRALSGTWIGKYHQHANKNRPQLTIPIICWIEPGPRKVRGTMVVFEEERKFYFSMEGTLHHDRFVQLQYTATGALADAIDFGVCFLALRDLPDVMDGLLTGWGSISETFISGTVLLKKKSASLLSKDIDYDALNAIPYPHPSVKEIGANPQLRS